MNSAEIILRINLEEVRKGLGYQRTMLNRITGHVNSIDDAALNLAMIEVDAAISKALKIAWELERTEVNRVSPVG